MNRREFLRNAASGLFLMKAAPYIFDMGANSYKREILADWSKNGQVLRIFAGSSCTIAIGRRQATVKNNSNDWLYFDRVYVDGTCRRTSILGR